MCRLPVTLGGGLTMVNGCASGRSGRNRPFASQWAYHFASIAAGSKVLSSSIVIARGHASAALEVQRFAGEGHASACETAVFRPYAVADERRGRIRDR